VSRTKGLGPIRGSVTRAAVAPKKTRALTLAPDAQQQFLMAPSIERVVAEHRIDPDRIHLLGHSMGGYGSWYLAHRAPERFASVVPISGTGAPWWTYRIAEAGIPAWVFHGEKDDAVPIAEAERMVTALEEAGGEVRFTRYPEGGHVLREPVEGDELFEWLLRQRRPP
jgi:predicted peptidase